MTTARPTVFQSSEGVLTASRQAVFAAEGYVLVPDVFSPSEASELKSEAERLLQVDDIRVVREEDGVVRTVFDPESLSETYRRLVSDSRLQETARRLLGGDVYVMQTQINPKGAFDGVGWSWHSDFLFWHLRDGMRAPDALSVKLYLDDVTDFNGPLYVLPGSHKDPVLSWVDVPPAGAIGTREGRRSVRRDRVRRVAEERGLRAPIGPAGSLLLFDCRLVHCAPGNWSPFDRYVVLVRYNRTDNVLPERPDARAHWKLRRRPDA